MNLADKTVMRPVIIGIVGPSGAGKTEICGYFSRSHSFVVIHASRPFKTGLVEILGVSPSLFEKPLIDLPYAPWGGICPREVAERHGNLFQELVPGAFAALLDRRITSLISRMSPPTRILVDGIRRTSEADVVRRLGGVILRIEKPQGIDPHKPCDLSQAEIKEDFLVHFGPISELHAQLARVADQILAPMREGEYERTFSPEGQ